MAASDPYPSAGQPMVEYALWYARHGWPVVPVYGLVEWADGLPCRCQAGADCQSPGKHPKLRGWLSKATTDPEVVERWWQSDPSANIGTMTGTASGVVIDIDPRNGGDETIRELERQHGPLPDTVESLTSDGGRHVHCDALGHDIPSISGALGPGVDIKCLGGMVVLPPSLHQSGMRHAWEGEHHPEDVGVAAIPDWAVNMIAKNRDPKGHDAFRTGIGPSLLLASVPEGERNDTLFRQACRLRSQGVDIYTALDQLAMAAAVCDPPLPMSEVNGILRSAWKYPAGTQNAAREPVTFRVEPFSVWAGEVDTAPDPGWIAEPVWPGDAYGVLAAESKAGKTWAQLDLAISVATGTDWMNAYPTQQGTVVVFLGEGGERNTVRRVRAILRGRGLTEADLGDRLHLCFRVPHLTDQEHLQEMRRVLAAIGDVRLVVLDPLYLAAGGANGASLYDMGVPLEAAQHVTQQAGAALVIVHHFNQTGSGGDARRMSGAGPEEWGRVLATVSVASSTVTDDGRTETAHLAWSFTGSEIVPTALGIKRTISVEQLNDLTSPMSYEVEPADLAAKQPGNAQTVLDVLDDHGGWLTTDEVVQRVSSLGKRAVQSALKSLHDDDQIERDGKQATGYSYRIPIPPATGGAS